MIKSTPPPGCTSKYSRRYVAVILVFLLLILIFHGYHHHADFKRHQTDLMQQSVQGASAEITAAIVERQRSVRVFVKQHKKLIQRLTKNPDDRPSYLELKKIINNRFPNSFAFTIADEKGETLLANFDLSVNEICQKNILEFTENEFNYDIALHPNPKAYHFDIMTAWDNQPVMVGDFNDLNISKAVFFISFKPTIITRILKNSQVHNHQLFLLKKDRPNLIEISAQGSRIQIPNLNGNFFLSPEQISRIGFKKSVDETAWDLVDIQNENILIEYRNERITQIIFIVLVFILISYIFLSFARREENTRLQSEKALSKMKDRLEQALSFSNVGIWEYDTVTQEFIWSTRARNVFHLMQPKTFSEYLELIPKSERQSVRQSFEHCVDTGLRHRIEHKVEIDGQNEHWIEITGNIETDTSSSNPKMIGLVRDITIRKLAEENRISFEIQQKNTLVREVHHRIKNSLQGVVGLLQQHGKYESIDNIMLDHAVSQLNSVSLVHGIQGDNSKQKISISQLVDIICKATLEIMGVNIVPNINTTPDSQHYLNEANAVPVALIINELIFNAAKHTSNINEQNIHIGISSSEHYVIISIQNDGAQLPDNFDFDNAIGIGTGLSLIKSLLPRQGAKLSIQQIYVGVLATFQLSSPVIMGDGQQTHDSNGQKTA